MINNSVKKCCICNNEKMDEFITINDNKYHLCCIENLQQENKELHNKIDRAIEELDRVMTFCENDSQGGYDICNMAIRNYKNIRGLLKDSDVDE